MERREYVEIGGFGLSKIVAKTLAPLAVALDEGDFAHVSDVLAVPERRDEIYSFLMAVGFHGAVELFVGPRKNLIQHGDEIVFQLYLCFSGTGNSYAIARELGGHFSVKPELMTHYKDINTIAVTASCVGIIAPVYLNDIACTACASWCPQHAIKSRMFKGQYHHPAVSANDLL